MANILYRASATPTTPTSTSVKSAPLTNLEVDANFKSINDDLSLKAPIASPTFTGLVVIPGGAINNTPIGAATASSGAFTTLNATGAAVIGGTLAVTGDAAFSSTGGVRMPTGTTAQRPTGAAGLFRYNSTLNAFEGYSSIGWGSIGGGGGATGAGGNAVFWENDQTITANYTLTSAKNAGSFGPITVADGIVVTVPTGCVWTIV